MGIEIKGLDTLMGALDKVVEGFGEKRREFHLKAGKIILKNVKAKSPYDETRTQKTHLRDAIEEKVGSGGGYVAVKPDYKKAPHAGLVENGHVAPNGTFVQGKHMFENGLKESVPELTALVEEFADEIVRGLK